MLLILSTTLPLFILILAGYLSAWRKLIARPGIKGLNDFVFYFALPLMLFHNMATAPVQQEFDGRFVLAYSAVAVGLHLTGMAVARWVFSCRLGEQAVLGMGTSFGNTVFIAMPISIEMFGTEAVLPISLLVAIENGILMPFTVALLEISGSRSDDLWRVPVSALNAILRNPIVMAVLLGGAAALLGIRLPALLEGLVLLVRGATVPCALFALGATLAGLPIAERLRETSLMVLIKLFAYPAVVFGAMALLPGLNPAWRAIAVITAAMPMGANVYLVAARYDTYVARASTGVMLSTLISVVTVSLLVVVLA
jgi:predicted permease